MADRHDRLISALAADLRPVRPLPAPVTRTLIWLLLVVLIAAALAIVANRETAWHRITASADMVLALLGSAATMASAALAAFELSLPDRSRHWALLPLPALALWIAASGLGCLRGYLLPGTHVATLGEARECLVFIVGLSVPLSGALFLMLRRGYSLAPGLAAAMAGLAAAAGAATLLNFLHPFDAAVTDLAVHAVAVAFVIGVARAVGRQLLQNSRAGP